MCMSEESELSYFEKKQNDDSTLKTSSLLKWQPDILTCISSPLRKK